MFRLNSGFTEGRYILKQNWDQPMTYPRGILSFLFFKQTQIVRLDNLFVRQLQNLFTVNFSNFGIYFMQNEGERFEFDSLKNRTNVLKLVFGTKTIRAGGKRET